MQEKIIRQYMDNFNSPTYRKMSKHLGIQLSRLYRIMGYKQEMKLSEYLKFQKAIDDKIMNVNDNFKLLFRNCIENLNDHELIEVEDFLEKKIKIKSLEVTNFKPTTSNRATA